MLIKNLTDLKNFCKNLPLQKDSILLLQGEMGVGKTTLAANILEELLKSPGPFTSPTFNLIHFYENEDWRIYHLDLYRLEKPEELFEIGLADLLAEEALVIIEWPEIAQDLLKGVNPARIISLNLSLVEGEKRIITKDLKS